MSAIRDIHFGGKTLAELSLGHRVDVDARTGAAQIAVAIPVTNGRGMQPQLSLAYRSGGGNTPYGLGWGLAGVSSIAVSLEEGAPRYDRSDTYAFGGVPLVPWFEGETPRIFEEPHHWVHVHRPRVGTAATRIEKWIDKETGDTHWRVRENGGIAVYGLGHVARICDPAAPERVFEWLLEWQLDASGNAIHYEYAEETGDGVSASESYELGRVRRGAFAQRYLRTIRYGNTQPIAGAEVPAERTWLFSVVVDYGERGDGELTPTVDTPWPVRRDPFSTFRPGFEVRTYRLCRRFLVFHHVPDELGESATPIGMFTLEHDQDPAGAVLRSVGYVGFRLDSATRERTSRALPPLVFAYTQPEISRAFLAAPQETTINAPAGIGHARHRMIDLWGEGLPGILTEDDRAWHYKPNLGNGHFGAQYTVLERPAVRGGMFTLGDFDGDGNPDLVVLQGREAGYYELDRESGRWSSFRALPSAPSQVAGARTQWIDVDGDGRADLVTVEQDRLVWYRSLGKAGFEGPHQLARATRDGHAPLLGADAQLDYFFADMTGDGSADQVRIGNGYVEYWPQLGNGRFGDGIVMEGAPLFDFDGALDPQRIRLVDLDGSGTADLVYIGRGEIRYWINASGNRFVEGGTISGLPYIDRVDAAVIADFLGNGTACLVWSTALPGKQPIHYLPLTGGVRPRLLVGVDNSLGKTIAVTYGHSAQHYLRDREAGRAWTTKLPRHAIVVDRIDVVDHVGNTQLASCYEYHDGYFDGGERAFRGFSLVDRFDSDSYRGTSSKPPAEHAAPSCVRTWFYPGADLRGVRDHYAGDPDAASLAPALVEDEHVLAADALPDAHRALAGHVVRTEIYGVGHDGARADHPYQVTQASFRVRCVQPARGERDACFAVFESERLSYHYEQDPGDPRIAHTLALAVDDFGNVTRSCTVAYPRRVARRIGIAAQEALHAAIAETDVSNIDEPRHHEIGVVREKRSYVIENVAHDDVFSRRELEAAIALERVAFDVSTTEPVARLVRWERMVFWSADRTGTVAVPETGARALVHHTEVACFPDTLVASTFGDRVTSDLLRDAQYVAHAGYWWQHGPTLHYTSRAQFELIEREAEIHGDTRFEYDAPYFLHVKRITDAAGNTTEAAQIDYQVLAPSRIVDLNGNTAEVRYDELGVTTVATSWGQLAREDGVLVPYGAAPLADYVPVPAASLDEVRTNPARFLQGASTFFCYDIAPWTPDEPWPARGLSLAREAHVHDGLGGTSTDSRIQIAIAYADGFGRPLQAKQRVEPGPASFRRDASGRVIVGDTAPVDERWCVSGHTVFDSKQRPVRRYEPYFSSSHELETDEELEALGVTSVTTYDPLGRVVEVLAPNRTRNRAHIGAWQLRKSDANDTVIGTDYARDRALLPADHPERRALEGALAHANSPLVGHLDPLGRETVIEHTGGEAGTRRTETVFDALGQTRALIDTRLRRACVYTRDMLARVLHEHAIDSGDKLLLPDALDQPRHLWDAAGTYRRMEFDVLRRAVAVHVVDARGRAFVAERMIYGEAVDGAADRNLRGRLVLHYDQAGVNELRRCDPAGSSLHHVRRLAREYTREPDWTRIEDVALELDEHVTRTRLDALGRPTWQHLPDDTIRELAYHAGGGVDTVRVDGSPILAGAVYDARGLRTQMVLGDRAATSIVVDDTYDRETGRLAHRMAAEYASGARRRTYQNLHFTRDPVGNVVAVADGDNTSTFVYDAFYQLREATGRVHRALERDGDLFPRFVGLDDLSQIRRYHQVYRYDVTGNLSEVRHATLGLPGHGIERQWVRELAISEHANRAVAAPDDNVDARFDRNGNLRTLPHLRGLAWNYRNNLASAVIVERAAEPSDAEYYVYGSNGMRIRKVSERVQHGELRVVEKVYLDGCELHRTRTGGAFVVERVTSSVSDGKDRIAFVHRWPDGSHPRRVHFVLDNQIGSVSLEIAGTGDVLSYEEYFPFGGTAFIAGRAEVDVAFKEYRYSGKERDDATRLYYYGYRYYAPWLARWLSPDPLGPQAGLNLYCFVHNNPVTLRDPNGLSEEDPDEPPPPPPPDEVHWTSRDVIEGPNGSQEVVVTEHTTHTRAEARAYMRQWLHDHPEGRIVYDGREYGGALGELSLALEETFEQTLPQDRLPTPEEILGIDREDGTGDGGTGGDGDGRAGDGGDGGGTGGGDGSGDGTTTADPNAPVRSRGDASDASSDVRGGATREGTDGNGTAGIARTGDGHGSHSRGGDGGTAGGPGSQGSALSALARPPRDFDPSRVGETASRGSTDPRAIAGGDPNGALVDEGPPGAVHGNMLRDGSAHGSPGGSPDGREPEELEWWQTALIVVASIAVAVLITIVTAGVGAILLGTSFWAVVAIGAMSGALAAAASDITTQALTSLVMTGGREINIDWVQTAQATLIGGVTGALTAGMGFGIGSVGAGIVASAESSLVAGTTTTALQRFALSSTLRYANSTLFRTGVTAARGMFSGGIDNTVAETGRQLLTEDELDAGDIGLQALVGMATGGALDGTLGALSRGGVRERFTSRPVIDPASGEHVGEIFGSMPSFLIGEIKPNHMGKTGVGGGFRQLREPTRDAVRLGYTGPRSLENYAILSYDRSTGFVVARVFDADLTLHGRNFTGMYTQVLGRISPAALESRVAQAGGSSRSLGFLLERPIQVMAETASGVSLRPLGKPGSNGPDLVAFFN